MSDAARLGPVRSPIQELDELLAEVRVDVDLAPGSGLNTSGDWWGATLHALDVGAVGYGVDAALDELARELRAEITVMLEAHLRESEVGLLLRLWLADRRGELRQLLGAGGRVADFAASDVDRNEPTSARACDDAEVAKPSGAAPRSLLRGPDADAD